MEREAGDRPLFSLSPLSLHPSTLTHLVAPPARAREVRVDVGQGGRVLLLKGHVLLPDLVDALFVGGRREWKNVRGKEGGR
jgi:hypothetical protein